MRTKFFYFLLCAILILFIGYILGCQKPPTPSTSKDTTAPTNPSIKINAGSSSTTSQSVTLEVSASDSVGVSAYYVSETSTTPESTASGWTSVTSSTSYSAKSISFTLSSGDGLKIIYAWFKDSASNVSARAWDMISASTQDTTAPTNPSITINAGSSSTTSRSVTLEVSASDSVGVTAYYVSETSTTPESTASGWTSVTSSTSYSGKSISFTLSSGSGLKTIYAWFKDSAGNVSKYAEDTISLSGWKVIVNTSLDSSLLGEFGLSFSDSDTGWAVGNKGNVVVTKNGTSTSPTAQYINIGSTERLESVFAYNDNRIWISGRDTDPSRVGSSVFYSGDGGQTWSVQANTALMYTATRLNTTDRLKRLAFVSSGNSLYGWVAGGFSDNNSPLILKTTDGVNWIESYRSDSSLGVLSSIDFYDLNNGMAVGEKGLILTTTNGGTSWTKQTSGTDKTLYEIRMTSSSAAIAVGASGTFLRTTDGGATWTSTDIGITTWLYALDVRGSKIWIGGDGGVMYYSSDSGTTWTAQSSNTSRPVNDIVMLTDTYGWAVSGYTETNKGAILKTTTGGN